MIKSLIMGLSEKSDQTRDNFHDPVMIDEVLEYLNPKENEIFVDGTLGMGGHALEVLKRIGSKGLLVGLDRDDDSLMQAKSKLNEYAHQCHFVHRDFRYMDDVLNDLNIHKVDGILLDLGISSFQLDDAQRGFSLRKVGPLDMRMDQNGPISAYDLINSLSEKEIASILKDFGEERWANRIARSIVSERSRCPIENTDELTKIILRAIPYHRKTERIHPATRTFQAFRIAVNRELEDLEIVIDKSIELLKPKGRLGIISFHSLEDRIVKNKFKIFEKAQLVRCLVKKPVRPSKEELERNPRSRSAKFRALERI